jgi:phosphohistidine phosphatase SixA
VNLRYRQRLTAGCFASLLLSTSALANTYQLFLVRHAEKAATSPDPELSECGQQQAQALATLLKDVQLPQLFHTSYQRTTKTAAALLQPGRTMQSFEPGKLTEFSKQLQQAEQSAVIVGHSNTTPELAALLSGKDIAPMSEQEYGVIYQLTFHNNQLLSLNKLQLPQPAICSQHEAKP